MEDDLNLFPQNGEGETHYATSGHVAHRGHYRNGSMDGAGAMFYEDSGKGRHFYDNCRWREEGRGPKARLRYCCVMNLNQMRTGGLRIPIFC